MSIKLNYKFNHPHLLEQALTHRSYSSNHYERLEFLGDSILGAVIAKLLFEKNPKAHEGSLTKLRSGIVNEKSLSEVAITLELNRYIRVGKSGEKDQVYSNTSVLADAVEALIGAIYVDGGFEAAEKFVTEAFEKAMNSPSSFRDFKSELQIIAQHKLKTQPVYKIVSATGPEHRKVFKVSVYLNGIDCGTDEGFSRKEAEQNAAKQALCSMI